MDERRNQERSERRNDRAEVRNAADANQVRSAEKRERKRIARRLDMYRAVMSTAAGRFVMWDLLGAAGIYRSCWSQSGMEIHRNVGRQDFGHELMATLLEVDETTYQQMESEMRALARRDEDETDAAHVAPATTEGDSRL